ncbi:MAG: ATP-binding protein [Pseudomonadaceae bacterium]|nr:ATP-binding protein [Pseudomonadaceae bacterium]
MSLFRRIGEVSNARPNTGIVHLAALGFGFASKECEPAPDGSAIQICLFQDESMHIMFTNTGAVPVEIRERFFEKFVTSGKIDGTGIGTYSAKLLTEAQGGSIKMQASDAYNRTEVTVTLPRLVP